MNLERQIVQKIFAKFNELNEIDKAVEWAREKEMTVKEMQEALRSVYSVQVLTTSVGALDSLDLEFYIAELEEAWEAVEDIKETIMQNYDVRAM